MGSAGVAEGEPGLQISAQVLDLLDVGEQLAVDFLLDVLEFGFPLVVLLVAGLNLLHSVL